MLSFALIISFWCIGITLLQEQGWPLHFIHELEEKHELYNLQIWKPLFGCVYCMSSVHGLCLWLAFQPVTILELPVSVVIAYTITRFLYPKFND